MSNSSSKELPWHQPGGWLVNSAYWDEEAKAARPLARRSVRFIECARAAVATNYGRHYLTFDEFRAICEGVMLVGYEARP